MNQHDFLNELLAIHPELEREYHSNQYKYSLEMIALMIELGLDSKKMAHITQLPHKDYLRLESGDITLAEAIYIAAIEKINHYKMGQNDMKFVSFMKTNKIMKSKYMAPPFFGATTASYLKNTRTHNKEQQKNQKKWAASILYSGVAVEKVFLKRENLKSAKKRISEKEALYQDFSIEVYKS